jgi:DNA repair protein RecO (recombination protein O)
LLTKNYGKIIVTARGARKPHSKFMAGAQLFTYSDFIIYDGGRFYSVAQVDLIENFFALRDDYTRLCLAQYFVEVCDKTTPLNAPCDELLHLLIISLSALSKGGRSPYLIARAFEMKFFQFNGITPEITRCAECGGALARSIRFGAEGTVCECYKRPAVHVSSAALAAFRYILSVELPDIFKFTVDPETLNEMKNALSLFFKAHFDVSINSLSMLDSTTIG